MIRMNNKMAKECGGGAETAGGGVILLLIQRTLVEFLSSVIMMRL